MLTNLLAWFSSNDTPAVETSSHTKQLAKTALRCMNIVSRLYGQPLKVDDNFRDRLIAHIDTHDWRLELSLLDSINHQCCAVFMLSPASGKPVFTPQEHPGILLPVLAQSAQITAARLAFYVEQQRWTITTTKMNQEWVCDLSEHVAVDAISQMTQGAINAVWQLPASARHDLKVTIPHTKNKGAWSQSGRVTEEIMLPSAQTISAARWTPGQSLNALIVASLKGLHAYAIHAD